MDAIVGVVYTSEAEGQLEALVDADVRYQLEPEQYEWLIERDPEGLGTLTVLEEQPIYIFVTAAKKDGPPRLAVSYRILRDERLAQILDVRPLP